jgi:hypothetical protein
VKEIRHLSPCRGPSLIYLFCESDLWRCRLVLGFALLALLAFLSPCKFYFCRPREIAPHCAGFYHESQHILLLPYLLRSLTSIETFLSQSVLEHSQRITTLPIHLTSCEFAGSMPISSLLEHSSSIFATNGRYEYRCTESPPDGGQRSVRPSVRN